MKHKKMNARLDLLNITSVIVDDTTTIVPRRRPLLSTTTATTATTTTVTTATTATTTSTTTTTTTGSWQYSGSTRLHHGCSSSYSSIMVTTSRYTTRSPAPSSGL